MNPFDTPPSGDPITSAAPPAPGDSGPSRGRLVLVAVLTAGLIGGGIAGVSQFVSADEPDLSAATAPDDPTDDVLPPADDADDDDAPDESDGPGDVEIVIDRGDGEPVVIELGDVEGRLAELSECVGLPMFEGGELEFGEFEFGEFEPGELPDIDEFLEGLPFDLEALEELAADVEAQFENEFGELDALHDGGSVTVTGPDGVSIVDLGENGSVTVTKSGDEITVETGGDATVSELEDLFGEFEGMLDEMFADGELDELIESMPMFEDGELDEFLESMPGIEEFEQFEPIDPEAVQTCLDEVLGEVLGE